MTKIGIYYGSTSGNTQDVAEQIAKKLGIEKQDLHDVANANSDFSTYDILLFGSSTYGFGDLQDDWDTYINNLAKADLNGKKVGLFGCGDSSSYSDTFCDALGKIYDVVKSKGCQIIGKVNPEDYSFDASEAVADGMLVGLAIDNDNESNLTDQRIACWVEDVKSSI